MIKLKILLIIFCFTFNNLVGQNVNTLLPSKNQSSSHSKTLYYDSQHIMLSKWIKTIKWPTDKPFDDLYWLYDNSNVLHGKFHDDYGILGLFHNKKLYIVSYEPRTELFKRNYLKEGKHIRKLYLYYLDGHEWKIASGLLIEDYFLREFTDNGKHIDIRKEYESMSYKNKSYIKKKDNGILEIKIITYVYKSTPYPPYNIKSTYYSIITLVELSDGTYFIITRKKYNYKTKNYIIF